MEQESRVSKIRKKVSVNDRYREILEKPNLSDKEIETMRQHLGLLARTICEHIWGKMFY